MAASPPIDLPPRPPRSAPRDGWVEGVRRIVVVRANGLGDLVFALPALEALRCAYPSTEITLIGRPHHAELLTAAPSPVDRVELAPPYAGVTRPEGDRQTGDDVDAFFERMQARRFDLALQLHGGGANSNAFTSRLGARLSAGFRARGAPPLDRWVRYTYFHHEVLRYLEAVALVGAGPAPSVVPKLAVTDADRAESAALLGPEEAPLAVLHPGATDPRRRWPEGGFAAVGRALGERGFRVVVSGDAGEASLAACVAEQVPGSRSIAGTLSLRGLLGLLERSSVVVANDSGPLHLAGAVGAPTVGIYWCGNAVNGGPVASHRHRPVIAWRTACPRCGVDCMTGRCDHADSFVADVPVGAVLDEVEDVLP